MPRLDASLPTLLFLLLSSIAAASAGDPEPQGPVQEVTWEVSLKGKPVGTERVREEGQQKDGGFVLRSEGRYQITETPFAYQGWLRASSVGELTSYALTSPTIRASAHRAGQEVYYGASYGPRGEEQRGEKKQPYAGPLVVLDSLCYAHYEAFARLATARKHEPFEFTLVTPQAVGLRPARFQPAKRLQVRFPQGLRWIRTGQVLSGALSATISYDEASGRAYRVEDSQGYVAETLLWPRAFREREIEIPAGDEAIQGTFTVPGDRPGPYPTLLILPGSGPTDRDSTIGPNKPLRDLAQALAAEGLASLRCDKAAFRLRRDLTSGEPAKIKAARARFLAAGYEVEYEQDALKALEWLGARRDVRQIVVCGHSQGAMAAPEIAAVSSRVAGVILLAGPARPLDVLLIEQTRFQLGEVQELPKPRVEASVTQIRNVFKKIRSGELSEKQNVMGATVRYWRGLLGRPLPPEVVGKLKQPVLLVQGAKDIQVRVTDYELIKTALEGREGASHEAVLFDDLNHLFMQCEKSTGYEYLKPGKVDARVPKLLARWVHEHFPAK